MATHRAYALVTQYGYSKELGNVDFNSMYENLSSETKQKIETEVQNIIEGSRQRAIKLLTDKRDKLEALAQALVEHETLTGDEIDKVMKGEKLPQKVPPPPTPPIKLPEVLLPAGLGGPSTSPSGGSNTQKSDESGSERL